MIFEFRITLRNIKDNTEETLFFSSTAGYIKAWKDATQYATDQLHTLGFSWYIDSIKSYTA